MIPSEIHIEQYSAFLSKLPIFKNISKNELGPLFQTMQVHQYHKGDTVIFDADQHANLYLVESGLFKLTKFDQRGDELVLRIVDQNDAISPMHFSPHYDISAEFVKDTTLIYFSKNSINNLIAKNHQFSMNIIQFLAESAQTLMLFAEVLQLKTTREKVGWYLVRAKINNLLEFPHPKRLIAAYLGMAPESFSRALTDLKNDGIFVKNRSIELNNGNELCQYCDAVTGSDCDDFKSNACIHH
ncbi:MAG TPA: Crp/Fnr family transcriptional regulator [Candidatus Thioglobus autotrophicus]|jgi:cAMP-binding proteins - catabolite gene activator and regulatory subunit of cAMP-dependent protein kinases|uniref:Crp/Fnr family transcriptional regulator n=1 Tax=Candidatus Thioglobus sp. TaxID=2026721 RepID=UPI0017B61E9B|nr:Crp/Fnr family transcriptional regulator [Candidatus Thioglobus sp.]HIL03979.1 Crp/Fnr family transcriptional regulator [Candidatus Thioglobus autotrophicus]